MIISRTPFRISFFGGGTDYPVWFKDYGGAVLATTINKYCYISCRYLPPFFDHKYRIAYSLIEHAKGVTDIKHPSVRETLGYIGLQEGVEIHHDADLPARSGLGSSSSFTVGLLHALYGLKEKMVDKKKLADDAIYIEQMLIKENVGCQDQYMAAFGGLNLILFNGIADIEVKPVIMKAKKTQELLSHLMLFFTGFTRTASAIAAEQINNIPKKKKELKVMQQMVQEALAILTSDTDIMEFGKLLHESWLYKRSLTDRISTESIDDIYLAAKKAGAIGGKLLGAGGGGFMLLFVPPEKKAVVRQRLSKLLHVPFGFDNSGSYIIFYQPDQLYTSDKTF
jgi:D-glycero-alpha-D-manno-heptose-7-phosphate kinase